MVLVCLPAFWRGGWAERTAAAGLLAGWTMTVVLYNYKIGNTQWGVLAVDAALFGTLTWIGLTSDRYWPLFAAAFQLLAVMTHLASILDPVLGGWAYVTGQLIFSYLLAGAIGFGAWTAWVALRETGPGREHGR